MENPFQFRQFPLLSIPPLKVVPVDGYLLTKLQLSIFNRF